MTIKFYVFYISVLIYCFIHSGGAASNNDSAKYKKRETKKWSTEEEEKLLLFDALTDDGKTDKFARVKSYWYDAYPNSNVSDTALYHKLYSLRKLSRGKDERRENLRWGKEHERQLLDIYLNTYPYKPNETLMLEEEWNRRYKEHPLTYKYLQGLGRQILKKLNENPHYFEPETPDAKSEWDNQHDSDLIHVHNIAQLERDPYWRDFQQMWYDLYPQYRNVSLNQLKERITHLKNNAPNENFPWTKAENKELLDIYGKTIPDKEDQGQRIYDIWSKIHPEYKFMTPHYLQIHASTLAHKQEMQMVGRLFDRVVHAQWRHHEKADLLDLYHQHLEEPARLHGFHKEWVRKHPRLAYLTSKHLKMYARKLEYKGFDAAPGTSGEGSIRQRKGKYRLEEKQEHHLNYGEISKIRKHSERQMEIFGEEQEAGTPMKFRSMKKLMGGSMRKRPEKRAGKTPLVYSSDEQEPSPPWMSEGSE